MNVFQVTTKVATLRERFLALGTSERSLASMLAEVIPQITTLLKD